MTWFNYVYMLSFIKLGISIVKYIPQVCLGFPSSSAHKCDCVILQVLLNYQRKSTDGWNIDNVMLDFTGGLLSFGQLIMDCACARDWSGISGDPVKFGKKLNRICFCCCSSSGFMSVRAGLFRQDSGLPPCSST
eukprot:SAG31_NODE_303_length_18065_cov_5.733107_3_plen_134_part_00